MRWNPCRPARHPLRGARTDPSRCASAFWWLRQGPRTRPLSPSRPRIAIHVRRVSERAQIPRHRELACLRPGARGKRLRRALYPNAQGELWVQTFDTIEQPRRALLTFRETYNATWLIERHGFIAPQAF